jgi:hypothetical protein
VAITDHYEPLGLGASVETTLGRVARWRDKWPRIADDAPQDAAAPRRRRTLPRLETGAVAGYDMPTFSRVRQCLNLSPTIGDHDKADAERGKQNGNPGVKKGIQNESFTRGWCTAKLHEGGSCLSCASGERARAVAGAYRPAL